MREWNAERESVPTTRARHRQRAWKASAALKAEVSAAQDSYYDAKQQSTYQILFGGKSLDQMNMEAMRQPLAPQESGESTTGAGLGSDYCDPLGEAGLFG